MRSYAGRILIRVPNHVHQELAREAFERGRSINQLCLEAIVARKALKNYNPWKAIEKAWDKNRGVDEKKVQRDILKAIAAVRHGR
ncbi:MAG: toxin-antitoxin system HicB family antitoxin [Elusimicrobia bacterium]|nr:toxin-antitoxin system HicB family antitoxin [Elusimicrobiota bacterium]